MQKVVTIILAAGASTRMGTPKQLLTINGESMVRRTVRIAKELKAGPVVVVLGASASEIKREIADQEVDFVINSNWVHGMGASLVTGMYYALSTFSNLEGVLFLLVDQPYLDLNLLKTLLTSAEPEEWEGGVSNYGDKLGVPAVFKSSLFPELLMVAGDKGARKIIRQHQDKLAQVPFPKGNFDLDSPEDWERFLEDQ